MAEPAKVKARRMKSIFVLKRLLRAKIRKLRARKAKI